MVVLLGPVAEAGPVRGGPPPAVADCACGTVTPQPGRGGPQSPHVGQPRAPGAVRPGAQRRALCCPPWCVPRRAPLWPHTDPHTLTPAPAVPDSDPGLCASLGDPRGVQVAEPTPRGGGASARASPRGREGKGGAGRRRPTPGDRPAPSPRAPAQCSCARPSLYSGHGRRALRTRAQRGGSHSGAEPGATGAGVRVPELVRVSPLSLPACLSVCIFHPPPGSGAAHRFGVGLGLQRERRLQTERASAPGPRRFGLRRLQGTREVRGLRGRRSGSPRSPGASSHSPPPPGPSSPLGYHGCSLDPGPLPRWVRTPRRPLPLRRAGGGWSPPRAVLSSQVRGCCCRSPRAAREPVSGGVPAGKRGRSRQRAGLRPAGGSARRCSPGTAAPAGAGARAGGRAAWRSGSDLRPICSGLPVSPTRGDHSGTKGTFFPSYGEGSPLSPCTPTSPGPAGQPDSRRPRQGVLVEPLGRGGPR